MPTIKTYLSITIDDAALPGGPFVFEQTVDEIQPFLPIQIPGDGDNTTFTALGIGEIDTVQYLFIKCAESMNLRIEGGESGTTAIPILAGGFVVVGNVTLTDTNIKTNNESATVVAAIVGMAGGT